MNNDLKTLYKSLGILECYIISNHENKHGINSDYLLATLENIENIFFKLSEKHE